MHKKDALEKNFFAYDKIFAQFWNSLVLRDAPYPISPDDLMDAPTEFVSVIQGEPITRVRDILKYYRGTTKLGIALMGLENQTYPDPLMPIRIMGYDWMAYDKQVKSQSSQQKIVPVVTIVIYFGHTRRWHMPMALSQCVEVPEPFKSCFSDYSINVIEFAWLTDEEIEALSGDLKMLALGLRCFRQRNLEHSPNGVIERPSALLSLLGEITGEPTFEKLREQYQEAEEVHMCEIFDERRRFICVRSLMN